MADDKADMDSGLHGHPLRKPVLVLIFHCNIDDHTMSHLSR